MINWTSRIDSTTEAFTGTFGNLSEEELNWKPEPNTWSIAQNIDHLITINESYFPVLQQLKDDSYKPPFISKFNFLVNFFGNAILKSVQPDRRRKTRTMAMWEPSKSDIPKDILERFKLHQEELKEKIESSVDFINHRRIISSPANRNIVYRIDTAFDIIVIHEQRHFEQAKEVLQMMND